MNYKFDEDKCKYGCAETMFYICIFFVLICTVFSLITHTSEDEQKYYQSDPAARGDLKL